MRITEISNRAIAITQAIHKLNSGDILLVAGKGHEKTQDIGNKKIFFSDRKVILNTIKNKNNNLSDNLKLNIIKEVAKIKKLPSAISFKTARINSQEVTKNDIFFAIRGKKKDGNKYVSQSFNRKASLAVVNKIQNKLNKSRQIKVKNTLRFLTDISKTFRKSIDTNIIAITGSCGKTTLKELLGNVLSKITKVSISPKSYNNKFGVPLSLFNLKQNDEFGILEVGMDKKGENDYLSNIIEPDVGVITNINYAHAKNFKNIKQIALAKSEIINNIKPYGYVVLNADDSFFQLHKKIAKEKKIKVVSFGSLTTDLCKKYKSNIILRGLRAVSDFEYEFQLAGMNRKLNQNIETIFLMSDVENQIISSKFVKEIVKLKGDIKKFTTKSTIKSLKEKI